MRARSRSTFIVLPAVAAALSWMATAGVALGQEESGPRKISRLAGQTTAISRERANTEADLQRLVTKFERDIRTAFAASGWEGNPDLFFAAVAEGKAEKGSVPVGGHIDWMAFRDKQGPTVMSNLEWAGRRPIDVWQVEVQRGVERATFVVPAVCLNVSLLGEEVDLELQRLERERREPPTCSVQATPSCDSKSLSIRASSAAAVEVTGVALDGRKQSLEDLRARGAGEWSFAPVSNGSYVITATATKENGVTGTCSARVTVDCPVPVCRLEATYDAATKRITVSSAGSEGDVSLTGLRLPDGSAGDVTAVEDGGAGLWVFNPRKSLPRAAGSYVYTFDAEADLDGEVASCSARASVERVARDDRWTLRFYGVAIDADGEKVETASPALEPINEIRERLDLGDGSGFGLGLEYRATDRIGVELSAIFGDQDSGFVVDIGEDWGMDNDTVSFRPILLGVNFHLLDPDAPVDLFVGPMIGIVQYGGATFDTLGERFERPFDDDDFSWGVGVGLDVPFGDSSWLFTGAIRYLETEAEDDAREIDFPVDPILFSAGLGVKF